MLKAMEHADQNREALAVLLTSTNKEEILLSVIILNHGEGNEARKILEVLEDLDVNKNLIIGCV